MAATADPTTPRAVRHSPPPRSSSSSSSPVEGAPLSRSGSASHTALSAPPRRSPSPPLSSNVPDLHAQVRKLRAELATLRTAHDALLSRSAELADREWAGSSSSGGSAYGSPPAAAATQARVRELEAALAQERARREEEEAKVMDLRIRGEESRRAIMRFQTEAAGAAQNNRRSMGPASLAGWNPAALPNASPQPGAEEDDEALARRKSKRASLAFGPTARADILAAGRGPAAGHRRTSSGGAPTDDGAPGAGGLRELRLGGTSAVPITLASEAASSTSRRSSQHSMLSPQGSHSELAPDDASPGESLFGLRHALQRARRGTAGSDGSEGAVGLAPPGRNGSVSPSPSSMTSPILEDDDESGVATFPDNLSVHSDAPGTARPMSFLGMHQAGGSGPAPRALAEAEGKLRAREAELERARKEMRRLGSALDEAREAREASEVCLRALRHFIEEQAAAGGSGSASGANGEVAADALKLPPLPTDLSAEDEEAVRSPGRKNSNNATWGARLGSTFLRATAVTPTAANGEGAASGNTLRASPSSVDAPAPPSRSLASMFTRAYSGESNASNASASGTGDETGARQASGMPTPGSDFGGSADSAAEGEAAAPAVPAAAATGTPLRGLSSWFSKRSSVLPTGAEGVAAGSASAPDNFTSAPPPPSKRQSVVASPPFASLDHSQLSRVPVSPPAAAGSPPNGVSLSDKLQPAPPLLPPRIEPSERAKRSASRTSSVAEDDGFVGPAFT
jgi:hypothetical protein